MSNHDFCRAQLREALILARLRFTAEEIKAAWAYDVSSGRGNQFEFHGPNNHYNHDVKMADCLWSAKAFGWFNLMDKQDDAEAEVCQSGQCAKGLHNQCPDVEANCCDCSCHVR